MNRAARAASSSLSWHHQPATGPKLTIAGPGAVHWPFSKIVHSRNALNTPQTQDGTRNVIPPKLDSTVERLHLRDRRQASCCHASSMSFQQQRIDGPFRLQLNHQTHPVCLLFCRTSTRCTCPACANQPKPFVPLLLRCLKPLPTPATDRPRSLHSVPQRRQTCPPFMSEPPATGHAI